MLVHLAPILREEIWEQIMLNSEVPDAPNRPSLFNSSRRERAEPFVLAQLLTGGDKTEDQTPRCWWEREAARPKDSGQVRPVLRATSVETSLQQKRSSSYAIRSRMSSVVIT